MIEIKELVRICEDEKEILIICTDGQELAGYIESVDDEFESGSGESGITFFAHESCCMGISVSEIEEIRILTE